MGRWGSWRRVTAPHWSKMLQVATDRPEVWSRRHGGFAPSKGRYVGPPARTIGGAALRTSAGLVLSARVGAIRVLDVGR